MISDRICRLANRTHIRSCRECQSETARSRSGRSASTVREREPVGPRGDQLWCGLSNGPPSGVVEHTETVFVSVRHGHDRWRAQVLGPAWAESEPCRKSTSETRSVTAICCPSGRAISIRPAGRSSADGRDGQVGRRPLCRVMRGCAESFGSWCRRTRAPIARPACLAGGAARRRIVRRDRPGPT